MSVCTSMPQLLTLLSSVLCGQLYAPDAVSNIHGSDADVATRTESHGPDCVKKELINSLLDWVQMNTRYDVALTRDDPPVINFCTVGELIDYEGRQILVDAGLNAVYDSQLRRITIVGPWDPNGIRDQSILLHELVHDVQFLNRDWYCLQQPEWEAYTLQDAWLQEQGVDSGFDWLYIYFLSRCPRDHHP